MELVAGLAADKRVWDAYGENAAGGIYVLGQPARALPFVVMRSWKAPNGLVAEELRIIAPSGRTVYRWGPEPRWMRGMMDLTVEIDTIEDALFDETGTYVVSCILDGEIVGEFEVPVYLQEAPPKLPKDFEDGLKRSDVIWVGVEDRGRPRTVPAWFVYRNGKIYVLSQRERGPEEQTIPGLGRSAEILVVTRRKLRDTALDRFFATPRLLQGAEWEEMAKVLVDRRRSRPGPPADALNRWRGTCDIAELVPNVPAAP
jgi:hypothetical protein